MVFFPNWHLRNNLKLKKPYKVCQVTSGKFSGGNKKVFTKGRVKNIIKRSDEPVVFISADEVELQGFTLQYGLYGVLASSNYSRILHNIIKKSISFFLTPVLN